MFCNWPKCCFSIPWCCTTAFWGVWDETGHGICLGMKHNSTLFSVFVWDDGTQKELFYFFDTKTSKIITFQNNVFFAVRVRVKFWTDPTACDTQNTAWLRAIQEDLFCGWASCRTGVESQIQGGDESQCRAKKKAPGNRLDSTEAAKQR